MELARNAPEIDLDRLNICRERNTDFQESKKCAVFHFDDYGDLTPIFKANNLVNNSTTNGSAFSPRQSIADLEVLALSIEGLTEVLFEVIYGKSIDSFDYNFAKKCTTLYSLATFKDLICGEVKVKAKKRSSDTSIFVNQCHQYCLAIAYWQRSASITISIIDVASNKWA